MRNKVHNCFLNKTKWFVLVALKGSGNGTFFRYSSY